MFFLSKHTKNYRNRSLRCFNFFCVLFFLSSIFWVHKNMFRPANTCNNLTNSEFGLNPPELAESNSGWKFGFVGPDLFFLARLSMDSIRPGGSPTDIGVQEIQFLFRSLSMKIMICSWIVVSLYLPLSLRRRKKKLLISLIY